MITSKARTIIRELLSALTYLALSGTVAPSTGDATAIDAAGDTAATASGSTTDDTATDLQPALPGLPSLPPPDPDPVHNAHHDLDQIRSDHDLDQDLDQIRSDQNGAQNALTLEQMLDAWKVTDPARSEILDSTWATAERFRVALELAEANTRRTSPTPIGLALYMLRSPKGRAAIDREIAATRPVPSEQPTLSDPVFEQVLNILRQQYGDLFTAINPRLMESGERPYRWVILVGQVRPELKASIVKLANGFSHRQYQVQLVTAWPSTKESKGNTHARSTSNQSVSRPAARGQSYTSADYDLAAQIRARQAGL